MTEFIERFAISGKKGVGRMGSNIITTLKQKFGNLKILTEFITVANKSHFTRRNVRARSLRESLNV